MMIETPYTLAQLATILSALDGQRRNPNTKRNALTAIGRSARQSGLSAEDVLDAADGLLDGRMSEADFRAALRDDAAGAATPAPEAAEAERPATDEAEAGPAADASTEEPATDVDAAAESTQARAPRYGTKQATMIEMLSRPEGATVDQIAEATGWQKHTVRGAIAGALKKKLRLTITTEKVRSTGADKEGAKGSYTIYRVVKAA